MLAEQLDVGELIGYIKELEEQNAFLKKLLEESEWKVTHLQLLHNSLLSRIYEMRRFIEEKKEPASEREAHMESVLATQPKSKVEMIKEMIFEDEDFKREIKEATEFAKIWKEKKIIMT